MSRFGAIPADALPPTTSRFGAVPVDDPVPPNEPHVTTSSPQQNVVPPEDAEDALASAAVSRLRERRAEREQALTEQQAESQFVDWGGTRVSPNQIREVAKARGTTPEAILRLGTWQGRLESRLASTTAGQTVLRAELGLSDLAVSALSLGARALGKGAGLGDEAEFMVRNLHYQQNRRRQFLDEVEKGGDIQALFGPRGNRIFNGVVESGTKIGVASPAGTAAVYSTIGAETFDKSLQQAKEAGKTGGEQLDFALRSTTIELATTILMGQIGKRFGVSSPEEALSPALRAQAAKIAKDITPTKSLLKAAGSVTGAAVSEKLEEGTIALLRQGVEVDQGLRGSFDWGEIYESAATGFFAGGFFGTARELGQRFNNNRQKMTEAAKGVSAAEEALRLLETVRPAEEAQDGISLPQRPRAAVEPAAPRTSRQRREQRKGRERAALQQEEIRGEVGERVSEQFGGRAAAARGIERARNFFETATPEMLRKAREPMNAKDFHALTGLKKTSKIFRDAFRETLQLYATSLPGGLVGQEGPVLAQDVGEAAAQEAAPAQEPLTEEGPQTPSQARQAVAAAMGTEASMVVPIQEIQSSLGRGVQSAKKFLKKNFTAAGLRNDVIDKANDQRVGRVAREMKEVEQLSADLSRAVRAEFGFQKLPPETVRKLGDALQGVETDLPENVLESLRPLRAHVDRLSTEIKEAGIIDESLELVFDENTGTYLTRTFRKFEDQNWMDRVRQDEDLMERGREWLKGVFPEDTPDQTEWRLNVMIDRDSAVANPVKGMNPTADFLSILKQRKNLPDVVRQLYGEFRDPWINYTKSISKMSQLLANNEFAQTVREAGLATGFLSEEGAPRPENFRAVDTKRFKALRGLEGTFTDPTTAEALEELFSPEFHGKIYRAFVKLSGMAKWNVTVGNSKTHVRNFMGNIIPAMSNGDLLRGNWENAIRTVVNDTLNRGDTEARAYIRELTQLGLFESTPVLQEIRDMTKGLTDIDSGLGPTQPIASKLKKPFQILNKVYQAGDAVWKILAFENKKSQYAEAFPDATVEDIKQLAAADVRDHYPTWGRVPRGVRFISKNPFLTPFITFYSEMVRTQKNVIRTISRDLRSPNAKIRDMARQRAVGMASSLAVLPILSQMSQAIYGVSDGEDDDLRFFSAPWNENSLFFHLASGEPGVYDRIDLSYIDPRVVFTQPIVALMRPGTTEERLDRAIAQAVTPFGEELLFGQAVSLLRNQTEDGRRIFNPEDTATGKAKDISGFLGHTLAPGTLDQFLRIRKGLEGEISPGGKPYDPILETAALIGFRNSSVDVEQSLQFKNGDMNAAIRFTESGILQDFTSRGTKTPGELADSYTRFNARRKEIVHEWHDRAMAAIRLGVPRERVVQSIVSASSKKMAKMVISDKYVPYRPGKETFRVIQSRPGGQERVLQLIRLFNEAQAGGE